MSGQDVFGRLSPRIGARQAKEVVGAAGIFRRNRGNIGTRIFAGRTAATFAVDATNGTTFHAVFRIAAEADWIAPIYGNGSTTVPYTVSAVKAAYLQSTATFADKNAPGSNWSTQGGSTEVPVARGAVRRKLVIGPRVPTPKTDRTDGGTEKLIAIRAHVAAGAGTITVLGNGANGASSSFGAWASRPDGLIHLFRNQTGDHVTNIATFNSTTDTSFSPIVGLQYGVRGKIVNVAVFGDSIDEGIGTYYGQGWAYPAVVARARESGLAIEYANFGWAGVNQAAVLNILQDATADGWVPDIVFYQGGTPNISNPPLLAAHTDLWRQYASLAVSHITERGGVPILRTVIPTNPAQKDWGATDALRVAHNAALLQWENDGVDVWDFSSVMSGETDGDGQVLMASGLTTDNIHPNDAGNAAGSELALQKLRRYAL